MIISNGQRVYRTIHTRLNKLWGFSASKRQGQHLNTLTGFICGILQSKEVKLADVAGEIPRAGREESHIMQLRRWLKNENINAELYYLPFIEALLHCLSKQTLILAIDGSLSGRGCITLMVSLTYKGRALPLLWITRKGKKGHFPENMHIELIQAVQEIIPTTAEVIVLGDGEFDGGNWLKTLDDYGWKFSCRTAKTSKLYEGEEAFTFQDICPEKGGMTEIADVEFTDKRCLSLRAVVYWGREYIDPLYLVSNASTGGEAFHWYKKRFRIETLFSDFKGRGFRLDKSGLRDPKRVDRLLIAVSLAYIWTIYLGEFALKQGWLRIIHRTDRCDLSLFQLGIRLLKRVLKEGKAIPPFCLTLTVDPPQHY